MKKTCRILPHEAGGIAESWAGDAPRPTGVVEELDYGVVMQRPRMRIPEPVVEMPPPPPPPPAPVPQVVVAEPDPALLEALAQESYDRGFSAGRTAAEEGLKHRFSDLAKALVSLEAMKERLRREAEQDQVQIAMAVARRVLRRELHVDATALRGLVSAAMDKLQGQRVLRVIVEPGLKDGLEKALEQVAAGDGIEVVVDANLQRGSILFETSRGRLDASFESQLNEIETGLADHLNRV